MISSSKLKWEWIIIVVLSIIILAGGFFLISDKKEQAQQTVKQDIPVEVKVETEKDKLLKKYEKLELAYNSTIEEIEGVVDDDNVNLDILKENLTQILETIKEEKEKISIEVPDSAKLIADDKTKQLDELLVMSKEVLAERIVEMKENNEKLTIDNRKLYYNLKKSVEHLEQEKSKNIYLNEETGKIKLKIATLKSEGISTGKEMRQLKKELEEAEKRLIESNKIIKIQNEQIEDLGEIIRKVNIDCYYIYERGNSIEEAKVYLTSQGISEKYVKYFVRKKPDIYVKFKIAKDLFGVEIKKVELKLYNSLNVEIYNIMKPVSSEHLKIIIPNRNFNPGKYSISLKAGDEDLILDERYWLKIAN